MLDVRRCNAAHIGHFRPFRRSSMTTQSRRRFLGALSATPAAAALAGGNVIATGLSQAAGADPVCAVIEAHKMATRAWCDLDSQIDNLQHDARERHGHRPLKLIRWRNYHIGGIELEYRRDSFIEQGLDPEMIEAEYRDAVERYERQCEKASAWDRRVGLADLRAQEEAAGRTAPLCRKSPSWRPRPSLCRARVR
jgi:hypothetical protein